MRSLILRVTLWTFSLSSLASCALLRENSGPERSHAPREQIFYTDYEKVWRAAQIALTRYPLRINNMDTGVLETDYIRGYDVWTPPYAPSQATGGLKYKLSVRVIKGRSKGRPANKVAIGKETSFQKDFFSKEDSLASDGLEEKTILYRIGRELKIDRALERAQKRKNNKSK